MYYTRPPYSTGDAWQPTRFIGLGDVHGADVPADKLKKYLHALNLTTLTEVRVVVALTAVHLRCG